MILDDKILNRVYAKNWNLGLGIKNSIKKNENWKYKNESIDQGRK